MVNVGEYVIRGSYGFYIIPYLNPSSTEKLMLHRRKKWVHAASNSRSSGLEMKFICGRFLLEKIKRKCCIPLLGGGFKYFFTFNPTWGNGRIWLIFFQMGWNHQLAWEGTLAPVPQLPHISPIQLPRVLSQEYPTFFPLKNGQRLLLLEGRLIFVHRTQTTKHDGLGLCFVMSKWATR